jgi:hypothetical protein
MNLPIFHFGYSLIFACMMLHAAEVNAQHMITGEVTDRKNSPVPYASVFIAGTYEGTVADDSGRYELNTLLMGKISMGASSLGMETALIETEIRGPVQHLNFQLKEAYASLSPVTITAGTFAAGEQGKAELLKPRDMGTTAGTPGDMQATIESLPGTQRVGYTEGLFVRGGSDKESRYIMDGLDFPNPYYSHVPSLKQRGRLDPFLFSGTVFSAGGYSAEYGQALSSVLILKSRGLADSTYSGGGIHSYGGNVFHTHRWKQASLYTNVNYNNLQVYHSLAKEQTRWTRSPVNKELKLVLRIKTAKNGLLKVYTDLSGTALGIRFRQSTENGMLNFDMKNLNFLLNMNYTQYFNDNKSSLYAGSGISYNADNIENSGSHIRESDLLSQQKILLKHSFTNDFRILTGGEYFSTVLSGKVDSLSSHVQDNLVSLFAEAETTISQKLALRIGVRSEYSTYAGRGNLVPRTSFAYKFSKSSQVSLSYGIFYELPDKVDMLYNPNGLSAEKARHFIVNYQYQQNDRTLRVEVYHKQYAFLVTEYNPQVNCSGYSGYARGFEIFFRDKATVQNLDAWLSYSYTDSRRRSIIPDEMITPDYVSKHSLALVGKYWIPALGILFSSSYHYATHRIFAYVQRTRVPAGLNIPAYSSMDISISRPMVLFHRQAMLFCSLQNITGYDKLLGYVYLPAWQEPLKIYRSEKRSFFIGLFFSMYNN